MTDESAAIRSAPERERPRPLTLRAALTLLLAGLIVVFVVAAVITALGARSITDRMAEVTSEARQPSRIATQLQLNFQRQVIALQGYVIGREDRPLRDLLLRDLLNSQARYQALLTQASALRALDDDGRQRVQRLRLLGEQWFTQVAQPQIAAAQQGPTGAARDIALAPESRMLQAQTEAALDEFQRYLDGLLERESQNAQSGADRLTWLMTGAVLLAAAGAVGVLVYLGRAVVAPLAALRAPIAAARRGRLDVAVPRGGAREVQELSGALAESFAALDAAQGALAREYERLRAVISNLNEGVIVAGDDGRIELANLAAVELLDLPGDGKGARLPDPLREALSAAEDGAAFRVPADERVLAGLAGRMPGGTTPRRIVALRDITEDARLERMKEEFIATVSHELRTPLTSIKGYTDLILDGGDPLPTETERLLTVVQRNADRLTELVNDLLVLSRIDAGRFELRREAVDTAALVQDAAATVEPLAAAKQQALRVELPEELPDLYGDQRRLHQVLLNLLGNAQKFTPAGGSIGIRAEPAGEQVRITVWDSGPGIPTADLPHLFSRFYRVHRPRDTDDPGGTGLGLAISRSIVELHGGRISVESRPGEGARFSMELPAAALS